MFLESISPKNQLNSSVLSWGIVDLRVLQSHLLKAFWLITQAPEFPQIWGSCKHKDNKRNFHLTRNSEKSKAV